MLKWITQIMATLTDMSKEFCSAQNYLLYKKYNLKLIKP